MIDRREFVKATAALAVTSSAKRICSAKKTHLAAGIQLYAVRQPLADDAPKTLSALFAMGYREVESAGTGAYSAISFRTMIKDAGLRLPSAHVAFQMDNDLGPLLEEAKDLGVEYATSSFLRKLNDPGRMSLGNAYSKQPALPPMGLEGFQRMAARMNEIGRRAQSLALKYAYHNHNFEFEALPNGKLGYDVLLQETDEGLVSFEVDCGRMAAAGVSPIEYFERYPGRFRMMHVKDFKAAPRPTTDMVGPDRPYGVELGRGFIDYKPIFAAGEAAGIEHAFAEQEAPYTRPQLDSAKVSYDFLRFMSTQ